MPNRNRCIVLPRQCSAHEAITPHLVSRNTLIVMKGDEHTPRCDEPSEGVRSRWGGLRHPPGIPCVTDRKGAQSVTQGISPLSLLNSGSAAFSSWNIYNRWRGHLSCHYSHVYSIPIAYHSHYSHLPCCVLPPSCLQTRLSGSSLASA